MMTLEQTNSYTSCLHICMRFDASHIGLSNSMGLIGLHLHSEIYQRLLRYPLFMLPLQCKLSRRYQPFLFLFWIYTRSSVVFFFWIQSRIFGPQELASGGGATAFPQKKSLRLTALSSILAPANICHSDMDKHVEQCRTMSNKGMLRYVKCEPK
jgi:hypothetical protein